MRTKTAFCILIIALFLGGLLFTTAQAAPPRSWMEPENPYSGDSVRFYYEDPNATSVFITVYSDTENKAYVRSDYGHDGDAWWIEVKELPGGDYHYKIDASGPDRYGNHTEIHFHVEGSSEIISPNHDGSGALMAIAGIFAVVAVIILVLRRKSPEE